MINIIFERVPIENVKRKTCVFIEQKEKVTWKKIFAFLDTRAFLPSKYLKLTCGDKTFAPTQKLKPFCYDNFFKEGEELCDFITFKVDYNVKRLKDRSSEEDRILYKIGILQASISSLHACGRSTTDLSMKLYDLKSLLS